MTFKNRDWRRIQKPNSEGGTVAIAAHADIMCNIFVCMSNSSINNLKLIYLGRYNR